jgi:DNA-binding transcriptional LysR family regulator
MLDLGRISTFRAVIAHGSFSAAGAAVSLTQPAVSRQVSLLERQIGTQLVRRSRRGVQPTEAGRLLLEHAESILGRLEVAERELAEFVGLQRGTVRLGSFFTALVYLSAEAAAALERHHPGLTIEDELVDRSAAFTGLIRGTLDVAIVFEHESEPDPPPDSIEIVQLFVDPARLLLPANHPLAARSSIRIADLADQTWIRAREGSAARLLDHVFALHGIQPRVLLAGRGDEPVEAQPLVAAEKGVTLAHDLNVIVTSAEIAVRRIADPTPGRRIQAAVAHGHTSPSARALLGALREVGRDRAARLRSRTQRR